MGTTISKLAEMKYKSSQENDAFNLGGEKGFLGSPPVKFPKTNNPSGTKNLDLHCKVGKIPEISKVVLFECLDELKKDGSYRFSGMEVYWADKTNGALSVTEQMSGEKEAWRTKEVGAMDFVNQLNYATKNHQGVDYVSWCGIDCQATEPAGAGSLQLPVKTFKSTNTAHTEGIVGFRLIVHKKLKVITDVIPVWTRVSDKKANLQASQGQIKFFLNSDQDVQADIGQKIYKYKAPENKYEDFAAFITSGKMNQEYLGGLPIRFLSQEEKARWFTIVEELKLEPLINFLTTKGNLHRVEMSKEIKDLAVKFLIRVLSDEFIKTRFNTRYMMKMICIVFNEDKEIWDEVKKVVGPKYKELAANLFDEAIDQIVKDPKLAEIQAIKKREDKALESSKYQKLCPQCPDKGDVDDLDKIAKKYMLDAAQYMAEFYATFRGKFGDKFHGAPVKGLDRIRSKAKEYQDEAAKEGKKLSNSDAVARLMDFLRTTIYCDNFAEMLDVFKFIDEYKGKDYKIVRVKNGFEDTTKKMYKSLMLNVMIFESQIVEIQLTIPKMKEANDINHFIFEYQREHSFYAMVSKNLNLTTAFQEWLDPIAPQEMKVSFPVNQKINWKGFWVESDVNSIYDLGTTKTKRCYFVMNFTIDNSGNINGTCGDPNGLSDIKGKIDTKKKTLEFIKTPQANARAAGPYTGMGMGIAKPQEPTYQIVYKAEFKDSYLAEGTYNCQSTKKDTGFLSQLEGAMVAKKGIFRIYCEDMRLPGLNPTLMAFRDVTKDSKIVRKKWLPTGKMKWTGYLGGSGKDSKDLPLTINMKIGNPLNWFSSSNAMLGKGKLGKVDIDKVDGAHAIYDSVVIDLFCRPSLGQSCTGAGKKRDINMNGFFIEDLKMVGTYDDNGHMGRWELECQDSSAKKKFAPKGDNEGDRWELLVTYMDGEKQYGQLECKPSKDGSMVGTGNNFKGTFEIKGKQGDKDITFVRTQGGESLQFDGQFISGGLYEGFFRSPTSYGKFKLVHA